MNILRSISPSLLRSRLALPLALSLAFTLGLAACSKTETTAVVPSDPPAASTTPVATAIDDTVVTSRVKSALMADDTVKSFDVSVETVQGEVRLSGMVDTQAQHDQAVSLARAVEGVTSVKNELTVKP